MARTVHKFRVFPEAALMLPVGARPVLFAEQPAGSGVPLLWMEVNPGGTLEERRFTVVGTGHFVPDGASHIASCVASGGALVWHLYEALRA